VWSATFSPDPGAPPHVVIASGDGTAKLWDERSGAPVLKLKGHAGAVYMASFSPDPGAPGRIVTCESLMAKVWDSSPFKQGEPAIATRLPSAP
jgi:WD40 repeat protein